MRPISGAASATLVALCAVVGVGTAPPASAYDPSINGTYTATVVGDWARTNTVMNQSQATRSAAPSVLGTPNRRPPTAMNGCEQARR